MPDHPKAGPTRNIKREGWEEARCLERDPDGKVCGRLLFKYEKSEGFQGSVNVETYCGWCKALRRALIVQ